MKKKTVIRGFFKWQRHIFTTVVNIGFAISIETPPVD
jgi:hypothetical protein